MSGTFKPSLGNLLQVLVPPLVWLLHLATVYAAEALICIRPATAAATMMLWTIALATAAALTALLLTAWTVHRGNARHTRSFGNSRFLLGVSRLLILLSLLGIAWTILPTIFLPACA
jgi:hypothetical protein